MYCANCGAELNANINFCPKCGTPNLSLFIPLVPPEEETISGNKNKIDAGIDKAKEVVGDVIHEVKTSEYVNEVAEKAQPLAPIFRLVFGLVIIGVAAYLFFFVIDSCNPPTRANNGYTDYSTQTAPVSTSSSPAFELAKENETGDSLENVCIKLVGSQYVQNGKLTLPPNVMSWFNENNYDAVKFMKTLNANIEDGGHKRTLAYRSFIKTVHKAALSESNNTTAVNTESNKHYEEIEYHGSYLYKSTCEFSGTIVRITPDITGAEIYTTHSGEPVYVIQTECRSTAASSPYDKVFIAGHIGYLSPAFIKKPNSENN